MKFVFSFLALCALISCGKKIEDRSNRPAKEKQQNKIQLSEAETWSIYSERPLPSKVKVVINDMEFVNECTGLGRAVIERTPHNGTINIASYAAFRQEYFDVDIFDCEHGTEFYSEDYVDQTSIVHPAGAPLKIILRLRN